jgi:hypothetical protein
MRGDSNVLRLPTTSAYSQHFRNNMKMFIGKINWRLSCGSQMTLLNLDPEVSQSRMLSRTHC